MHQKTFQELCEEINSIKHIEPIPLEKMLEMNKYMDMVHQEYLHNQNIPHTPPDEIIVKNEMPPPK